MVFVRYEAARCFRGRRTFRNLVGPRTLPIRQSTRDMSEPAPAKPSPRANMGKACTFYVWVLRRVVRGKSQLTLRRVRGIQQHLTRLSRETNTTPHWRAARRSIFVRLVVWSLTMNKRYNSDDSKRFPQPKQVMPITSVSGD